MRRTVIATLVAGALAAATLLAAAPARAVTANPSTIYVPVQINNPNGCGVGASFFTGPNHTGDSLPPILGYGIVGATGDTVTVVNECAIPVYVDTGSLSAANRIPLAAGGSATFAITSNGPRFEVADGQNVNSTIIAKTGVSGTSPIDSGPGPDPVLQQFGKPAAGTCDDAQPANLNWGGVASGGWGVTWAEWMNDRKGGYVCSRTLVYRSGAWTVV